MDVEASLKGRNQAGIARKMRNDSKLNLVVVGDEQLETAGRNEGTAKQPTLFGTHRDVVQIRFL